jgi:hypothetical protein
VLVLVFGKACNERIINEPRCNDDEFCLGGGTESMDLLCLCEIPFENFVYSLDGSAHNIDTLMRMRYFPVSSAERFGN